MRARTIALAALLFAVEACAPPQSAAPPKNVLVVGIDVSGSFRPAYQDALDFASYYIYGHMHGLGGLRQPTAIFVASVGGDRPDEPKSFHPIHDFEDKTIEQIRQDLETWFPATDRLTDYNAFFDRIASLIKQRNLVLAPLNIVVLTDGMPDVHPRTKRDSLSAFASLKVEPLEYLSRNVTVRLLYPTPTVAVAWERGLKRQRVRLWTLDAQVMKGWHGQVLANQPPDAQDRLWRWMEDNVDFRVRGNIL
jgi:hypothetical protein